MLLLEDVGTNSTTTTILSFKSINQVFKIWYFTIHVTTEAHLHCYYNNYDTSRYILFKIFLMVKYLRMH